MAWCFWFTDESMKYTHEGILPCQPYEGAMAVVAPGHGKTTLAIGRYTQKIARNNFFKLVLGHARAEDANKNATYIKSFFDGDSPGARRLAALYKPVVLSVDSAHKFTIDTGEKSRQPTVQAAGVTAKIAGADASEVWLDDPVDRAHREQPEERRRTAEAINGNWLARLRGKDAKYVITTTLWHEDDANFRRLKLAREGKIRMASMVLRCGGPEDRPKFYAVWPEMYPSSKLKSTYQTDPAMYAAAYMADPRTESMQIIRKLRYYNPMNEEHRSFLMGATKHLSLDPSASSRQGADKSGIIYAAAGTVQGVVDGVQKTEQRCRILDGRQMNATQSDLVNYVGMYASTMGSVDYVHVEVVQGFAATPEMLSNQFGIDAITHTPGIRSKEVRLRGVAGLIDDSRKSNEFGGAVVEFPGAVMEDGSIGPDQQYQWLYDQFLRFGVTKDDHCLDATTQLVAYLQRTGDLSSGAGWVTQQVQRAMNIGADPRLIRMIEEAENRDKNTSQSAAEEEGSFMGNMGGGM